MQLLHNIIDVGIHIIARKTKEAIKHHQIEEESVGNSILWKIKDMSQMLRTWDNVWHHRRNNTNLISASLVAQLWSIWSFCHWLFLGVNQDGIQHSHTNYVLNVKVGVMFYYTQLWGTKLPVMEPNTDLDIFCVVPMKMLQGCHHPLLPKNKDERIKYSTIEAQGLDVKD